MRIEPVSKSGEIPLVIRCVCEKCGEASMLRVIPQMGIQFQTQKKGIPGQSMSYPVNASFRPPAPVV